MKRILLLFSLAAFGMALAAQPSADPKEIVLQSRNRSRLSGIEARTTLTIADGKGKTRVRETTMASRIFPDGTEKRTIIFQAPADVKGTAMLIWDFEGKADDMWIYMPALRKSRKIVATEKSKSFMGSEFSNSDLTMESTDDFTYRMEGEEAVGGEPCWKIRITPASGEVASEYGISHKTTWFSKKDYMPRRSVFTDREGKTWKELDYLEFKLLDQKNEKYFITRMEIRNLKNGRSSRMDMSQITFNPSVREEYFTLSFIEKQ